MVTQTSQENSNSIIHLDHPLYPSKIQICSLQILLHHTLILWSVKTFLSFENIFLTLIVEWNVPYLVKSFNCNSWPFCYVSNWFLCCNYLLKALPADFFLPKLPCLQVRSNSYSCIPKYVVWHNKLYLIQRPFHL